MHGSRFAFALAAAALVGSFGTPAKAVVSDTLELTDGNGAVLTNPQCPLVAGVRNCSGELTEGAFPAEANGGFLRFRVPAPAAGQFYRNAVVTLTEVGNATLVSDKLRLLVRRVAGGSFDLTVSIAPGSDLAITPTNMPEALGLQNLTAQLFANSTAGIQAAPPFQVMFNSDCPDNGGQAPVFNRDIFNVYGAGSDHFTAPADVCFLPPPLPVLPGVPEPASLALLGAGMFGLWRVSKAHK